MIYLEFIWYSLVCLVAGAWLLSRLLTEDTPRASRRAAAIVLLVASITAGYLLAFEKPAETAECRPSGAGIYHDF